MELGLSQEQLADRIGNGVRQADVSRLERGRVALPRPGRLRAIAAALGLEPGELLARSGWPGADSLPPDPSPGGPVHHAPRAQPAGVPEGPPAAGAPVGPPAVRSARLAAAIEEARHVRARARDIMIESVRLGRVFAGGSVDSNSAPDRG